MTTAIESHQIEASSARTRASQDDEYCSIRKVSHQDHLLESQARAIIDNATTGPRTLEKTLEKTWKRPCDCAMLALYIALVVDVIKDCSLTAIHIHVPRKYINPLSDTRSTPREQPLAHSQPSIAMHPVDSLRGWA